MSISKRPRPNVLLLLSDEQRYDTLGCTGREHVSTPNIDRLAENGMLFENAFCTTPICTPSRASIFSGLYPHSHGMVANHQMRPGCDQMLLRKDVKLIADYLKPAGYFCGYTGKWHLGSGYDRRGFSDFKAAHFNFDVDRPEENEIIQHAKKIGVEVTGRHQGGIAPDGEMFDEKIRYGPSRFGLADHPASLMCDRAVEFIDHAASLDQPFMLVWSTHEPHPPWVCPEPFISMYDSDEMILPESLMDIYLLTHLEDRLREGHARSVEQWNEGELRQMWAGYLGEVSFVDFLTGRIIAALHQKNLFDNTLIIFTSDHGELLGSHGFIYKGPFMFDELMRVPLVIVPPGWDGNPGRTQELVSLVDLMPTIMDYCGVEIPEELHGVSIASLTEGDAHPVREGLAGEYHSCSWAEDPLTPLRMWRTDDCKYIESQNGISEFYDLVEDPDERNNKINDLQCQGQIGKMQSALSGWLRNTGDTWPNVPRPPNGFLRTEPLPDF